MNNSSFVGLFAAILASTAGYSTNSVAQDGPFSDIGLAAGAYVTITPVYEGSDDYKVGGVPIIYPTFGGGNGEASRLYFLGIDDIRYAVFRNSGLDAGPLVGYRFGRDVDDAAELGGLNNPNGGLVVGGFAQYGFGGAFADIAASKQVSGLSDSGFLIKFGAGYDFDITERLSSRIYASGTYASEDYMDQYFSISATQAAASVAGYSAFNAGAGVKNVELNASVNFEATERLSLRARAGYSRILGDAADSPITINDNQYGGSAGFIFKF